MRMQALLILTAGLAIAADAADDAKKELKRLAGTYAMVSGESKAGKESDERVKEAKLVVDGNKYTATFGSDSVEGKLKIDPTKSPKEIDATDAEGKTILGIYKFEKGQFTVCFAGPDKERPKEFSIEDGTGEFMHVWKKKPKE